MLKRIKTLVSRLSLCSSLKTHLHRKMVIGLKRPVFDNWEKELLVNIAKSSAWHKLRLNSHNDIFHHTVVNGVTDDFRRGYLECFAEIDDLIKSFATTEQSKEIDNQDMMISMQGLEDDKTDF